MAWQAAAIAAGANLLGTHMRNKEARKASARQMAFQREMSDTSYVRGMADMKKAGLNPILAGKVGGASTPTGSTYNPENVATNATNAYLQTQQNIANVKQTEANTALTQAQTNVVNETGNSFMGRNIEYIKNEIKGLISNVTDNNNVQSALDRIKAQLISAKQQIRDFDKRKQRKPSITVRDFWEGGR
jgi:cation transport regulator ChaC